MEFFSSNINKTSPKREKTNAARIHLLIPFVILCTWKSKYPIITSIMSGLKNNCISLFCDWMPTRSPIRIKAKSRYQYFFFISDYYTSTQASLSLIKLISSSTATSLFTFRFITSLPLYKVILPGPLPT